MRLLSQLKLFSGSALHVKHKNVMTIASIKRFMIDALPKRSHYIIIIVFLVLRVPCAAELVRNAQYGASRVSSGSVSLSKPRLRAGPTPSGIGVWRRSLAGKPLFSAEVAILNYIGGFRAICSRHPALSGLLARPETRSLLVEPSRVALWVLDQAQRQVLGGPNKLTAVRSCQFGRASAPKCPQRSHRSLGPNDGTGRSSG